MSKVYHLAVLIPLAGLFLLMPPAILIFGMPVTFFGIPLSVVYVFVIWGLLIVGAAVLARALRPAAIIERAPCEASIIDRDQQS